jgi:enoyl-CoA hydratase
MVSHYRFEHGTAHISVDDGKVNALGSTAIADLNDRLDQATQDQASAAIISGRPGVFSAGFDLKELRSEASAPDRLRIQLIDLGLRIFTFECPVVVACTGHALAAGAALLLAGDRRIGIDGPFKLGFNEASLGVSISAATVELARYRMPMPWFESLISGTTFSPRGAQSAGLLDEVVDSDAELTQQALKAAETLGQIPRDTFHEMRRLARGATVEILQRERRRLSPS